MGVNDRVTKKTKSTKSRKKRSDVTWQGFIEVPIDKDAASQLEAMDCETEFPYTDIEWLVREGYKVTFSCNAEDETHRVTLTDMRPESPTAGYAVSGWGGTPHDAFSSVMYKHRYMMPDGWGAYQVSAPRPKYA